MCIDTERLEMLIALHIFSFLMSHDSSNISLGGIESNVLDNQSGEVYCYYLCENLIFNIIIHLIVRILGSILNP